jgi:hypothetical protein
LAAWYRLQVAGVRVALMIGAVPVPLSETGEPVTFTLAKMVTFPLTAPIAVGVKTTVMVQVEPVFKVVPQVPPDCEKTVDEKTGVMPVPGAVPVLCNVRVCAALVVPVDTLPNASGPPVTLSVATGAVEPNSTAPGSMWTGAASPGSGLKLPKKSVVGTRLKFASVVGIAAAVPSNDADGA